MKIVKPERHSREQKEAREDAEDKTGTRMCIGFIAIMVAMIIIVTLLAAFSK